MIKKKVSSNIKVKPRMQLRNSFYEVQKKQYNEKEFEKYRLRVGMPKVNSFKELMN